METRRNLRGGREHEERKVVNGSVRVINDR
jgi:hypothetical protein